MFEGRNRKKTATNEKEKILFHQDNASCHKSIAMMAKLHGLHFELFPHPHYSSDLAPSGYWLFADLKRMLQRKTFDSNEEVISENEAYFEAKDKSFYKKGIEWLEKRWNQCITPEGDYFDEKSRILPKTCCFISKARDLLSDVLYPAQLHIQLSKEVHPLFHKN